MPISISKLSYVILLLCIVSIVKSDIHCEAPQKAFYMSYNAQSKKDTIPVLFTEINKKMSFYNYSYNDGKGVEIVLKNLRPQFYYNEHHQIQVPIDQWHVNVTLGAVSMAVRFDFQITNGTTKKNGFALAHTTADQTYFIKQLLITQGYLQWQPISINPLTASYITAIQFSQPMLNYDQKSMVQLILDDHLGERKLKSQILIQFNTNYKTLLKQHLNKEQLIGNQYITYKYKNIEMKFINTIKQYKLSLSGVKGLQAWFHWQVENQTFNCTQPKFDFNFNNSMYGGLQEWYSISSIKQAFLYALSQGLFDVKIDKTWQVPQFQFYMGDLANAVPYANKYAADEPFDVSCKWSRNKNVTFQAYAGNDDFFCIVQELCLVQYKGKQLFQLQFDISIQIGVIAQEDSLDFIIRNCNKFGPKFKPIDPNFVLGNQLYFGHAISMVIQGLVKSKVFGTGWKVSNRKFPSVHVIQDYMVVFDASEI